MQMLNITISNKLDKLSLNDVKAKSIMNNSDQIFKSYIPTLSKSQVEIFNIDEYLMILDVLTASECDALHDETQKMIQNVIKEDKEIRMQEKSEVEQMLLIDRVLTIFEMNKYTTFHACFLFAFEKR